MKANINKKTKILKQIPHFKSEDEERVFWDTHSSADYFDWSKARHVIFPNLQLTKKPISLRVTTSLLAKVKMMANKKDIPYQSLMKLYIADGLKRDYQTS